MGLSATKGGAMTGDPLTLYVYLGCFTLVWALILAVIVKLLARKVSFSQAFLVSLVAAVVSTAFYVFYTLSVPALGLGDLRVGVDALAKLITLSAVGIIITRLLRQYGIE